MRKVFLLVNIVFLLVIGMSFASCLNSDDSPAIRYYVRVQSTMFGFYYFEDALGNKFTPTETSAAEVDASGFKASETNLAYIAFEFVEETQAATSKETTNEEYTIKLLGAQSIDGEDVVVASNQENMEMMAPETAPVGTLKFTDSWGTSAQPMLFDLDAVMVPISFYLTNDNEKFKMHKLYLACNLEDVKAGDTELVFYVRHDRGEDENASVSYAQWYGFDIRSAISEFVNLAGATPSKLIIKAHETSNPSTEIPEQYQEYEIEYKMPELN